MQNMFNLYITTVASHRDITGCSTFNASTVKVTCSLFSFVSEMSHWSCISVLIPDNVKKKKICRSLPVKGRGWGGMKYCSGH